MNAKTYLAMSCDFFSFEKRLFELRLAKIATTWNAEVFVKKTGLTRRFLFFPPVFFFFFFLRCLLLSYYKKKTRALRHINVTNRILRVKGNGCLFTKNRLNAGSIVSRITCFQDRRNEMFSFRA